MAAIVENGAGHGAHEADIAAAIDKVDAALGHGAAQCRRIFDENGVVPEAGAAINTNGLTGLVAAIGISAEAGTLPR